MKTFSHKENDKFRKLILKHYLTPKYKNTNQNIKFDYSFHNEYQLKNSCADKIYFYFKLSKKNLEVVEKI
jgi:NifU-like protein involved in Fe-S cluster formation